MTGSSDPVSDLLPLRVPTYLILLSLAQGKKHGYAILKDVEDLSQGKVKLSTGTLYEALARLLDQNLIERTSDADEDPDDDQTDSGRRGKPRKAYRLSKAGRMVLQAETDRMQALLVAASRRLDMEYE